MSYFTITKINDYIYQFNDRMSVLSTLVIGTEKALLLDTCYGIGDLKKAVEEITDLPLIVVNSHGHMDHSCGNYQFSAIYIDEKDFELCKHHNSLEFRQRNLANAKAKGVLPDDFNEVQYLNQKEGYLISLNNISSFDLGGLNLEVVSIPGHTNGSIALYIKESKIMLVSDGACPYIWLFLPESTTVDEYIKSLKKLISYEFEYFLVGHGAGFLPKEFMYRFLRVAESIDLKKAKKVEYEGFESTNAYAYCENEVYEAGKCGIIFNALKIH